MLDRIYQSAIKNGFAESVLSSIKSSCIQIEDLPLSTEELRVEFPNESLHTRRRLAAFFQEILCEVPSTEDMVHTSYTGNETNPTVREMGEAEASAAHTAGDGSDRASKVHPDLQGNIEVSHENVAETSWSEISTSSGESVVGVQSRITEIHKFVGHDITRKILNDYPMYRDPTKFIDDYAFILGVNTASLLRHSEANWKSFVAGALVEENDPASLKAAHAVLTQIWGTGMKHILNVSDCGAVLSGVSEQPFLSCNSLDGITEVPGIGKPSVYHAVIIIFLEFFSWGLLTTPVMDVLKDTFQANTLLINGLVYGIKGLLSFLCAPLLGALSDVWGRKSFLILTVFFTCAPIPILLMSPWWFFAMTSISGAFAVTFSIVFAYVADITEEENRSSAYGLVSATFAASLVTSPAIGAYLSHVYGKSAVVMLATAISALDVCFILIAVPESLPEKLRPSSWGAPISWDQADPFASLRKVGGDPILLLLCTTVFLSYLPEAGQYSCIFVYLRHVMGFGDEKVASFIAVVGVLAIVAQTAFLTFLFQTLGNRTTILLGLAFQTTQLLLYAFGRSEWMMWLAGLFAALSAINYPALSSLVSSNTDKHQQGVVQGMVTGIRGLCNGLGPALFGLVFYIFGVDIDDNIIFVSAPIGIKHSNITNPRIEANDQDFLAGPPFLFGAMSVVMAMLIALMIPNNDSTSSFTYLALPMPKKMQKWVMRHAACRSNHTESDFEPLDDGKCSDDQMPSPRSVSPHVGRNMDLLLDVNSSEEDGV